MEDNNISPAYAGLGVAVGVFLMLSVPAMLVIEHFRKGAFPSMIAFEVGWLGFLDLLLFATGIASAVGYKDIKSSFRIDGCSRTRGVLNSWCTDTLAIIGLAWFTWLCVTAYIVFISFLARKASGISGASGWKHSVRDVSDLGASNSAAVPMAPTGTTTAPVTTEPKHPVV